MAVETLVAAQDAQIMAMMNDVTAIQTAQAEADGKIAAIEMTVTMMTVAIADQVRTTIFKRKSRTSMN